MKIALVGPTHPFRGGIAHYTTLLARSLRHRHDVRFFALSRQYPGMLFPGKTQRDHSENALHVDHEACLDSINCITWWTTFRKIRKFEPELLLFSWWHPFFAPCFGTLTLLARQIARIPVCYICHNVLPHERSLIDRILLRYAFSLVDAFVTHAESEHEQIKIFKPKAITVINPHPTYEVFANESLLSAEQAKIDLKLQNKKVLLFFGFIRRYKGLQDLLDAMESLSSEDGYHLLLVGEFYDSSTLYQPALDRLQVRGQLTMVDRYVSNEEIPLYFRAADVLVAPYLSATQSGVIQMAYAFQKPVIATDVGGIPEVVENGSTGFLLPPGNPAALASAVQRYFTEDHVQAFAANIARKKEIYSWNKLVETIEGICCSISRST